MLSGINASEFKATNKITCVKTQRHTNNKLLEKSSQNTANSVYNPIYYKPITFRGSNFDVYFPEKILKVSEKQFDEMILKVAEDPTKRNKLAEYVTSQVAKDNQTMNFINMWKRQVPTLISQGLLTTMPANSSDFFRRIATITSRNSANSSFQKFRNSEFQDSILLKDTKSAGAGLLSWQLFSWANADPEPYTKVALYTAAIVVGAIGYNERSKDTKEIQNKQFLQAIKEMIKLGALDPCLLINHIDKNKLNLSPQDQKDYLNWQESRIKDLRYQKTGSTVNKHNDFAAPEAQNALVMFIGTLQNRLGFDDEKIALLLQLYAAEYDSIGGSQEAEHLTRMVIDIYEELDIHKPLISAYENLGYFCMKNDKPSEAISAFDAVKLYSYIDPEGSKENRFRAEINIFDIKQNQIKKQGNLRKLLLEDYKISKSEKRKDALSRFYYDNNLSNSEYDTYSEDDYKKLRNELTGVIVAAANAEINDKDFELMLKTISKMPLPDLKFTPEDKATWENNYLVSSISRCKDDEESVQAQITKSNNYIQKRADNLNLQLINNEAYANMDYRTKAQMIVGINVLKGSLEDLVSNIFNKELTSYTKTDTEILKILSDNLYQGGNKDFYEMREGYDPLYMKLLLTRMYAFNHIYGEGSKEVYKAAADIGLKDKNTYRIIYQIIPTIKNYAPESLQKEVLPDLYARYAKYKTADLFYSESNTIADKEALDIIAGYVKYFDNAKKLDQNQVLDFLKFLERIYKNKPTETTEVTWYGSYNNAPVFNVPLFDDINNNNNTTEFEKIDRFMTWHDEDFENPIKSLVERSPGIFRINERKFLDMQKQFESVIFQNRFNQEMDIRMKTIEKDIDIPEDLT